MEKQSVPSVDLGYIMLLTKRGALNKFLNPKTKPTEALLIRASSYVRETGRAIKKSIIKQTKEQGGFL